MAVITLENGGEDVTVGGADVTVRGTASGGEVVTVVGGNIVLDASFGLGGDTVALPGVASQYSAVIVGSRLVLSGPGTEISLPLSQDGISVEFSNGDTRFIEINDDGQVVVGDQVIPMGPDATDLAAGGPLGLDFTPEADDLQGTAGDDVFDGSLDVALGGLVGVQTLQGADSADGGGGADTLNAELNSTGTTQNPQLANIEVYNLTSYGNVGGGGGTSTLNLARASGYEQLWNRDSTGSLTLNNVGEVAVLGVDGVQADTTYTVIYDGITVEEQNVVAMGNGFPPAGNTLTDYADLNITGVAGPIGQLNLAVSDDNALNLQGAAASATNVDIDGDGLLSLMSASAFGGLETLDSTGYDGDLVLDISGSTQVTDVETGDGDDNITMNAGAFASADAPILDVATNVDLGAGSNTLTIAGALDEDDVSALVFDNGSVDNVQTLNLQNVTLDDDATLALDGVTDLETLQLQDLDADGNDLDVSGGPEVLTIQGIGVNGNLDFDGANLTVDDASDLTLESEGVVDVDLYGDSLEQVSVTGGDADVFSEDITTLQSLSVTATDLGDPFEDGDGGDANVVLEDLVDDDDADFASLETVSVESVDGDASLTMQGDNGTPFVAGIQEVWEFTVDGSSNPAEGTAVFSSSSLIDGTVLADYASGSGGFFGQAGRDANIAGDLVDELSSSGNPFTVTQTGGFSQDQITVVWDEFGDQDNPDVDPFPSSGTTSITGGTLVEGRAEEEMVPGVGFESLTQANVLAAANATVDLEDVYGDFELNVAAGEDADVDLINTQVAEVTVSAGGEAEVFIGGDTVGAQSLTTLTISSAEADVDLNDDIGSLRLIDISGVTEDAVVNSADADFDVGPGDAVEYLIGYTVDDDDDVPASIDDDDVFIVANEDNGEVFTFVGDDIGFVRLGDEDIANGAFEHDDGGQPIDRIDLSSFGYTGAGQLEFNINGDGDLVITDAAGGPSFSGQIVIDINGSWTNDDVNDFAANNIIFA